MFMSHMSKHPVECALAIIVAVAWMAGVFILAAMLTTHLGETHGRVEQKQSGIPGGTSPRVLRLLANVEPGAFPRQPSLRGSEFDAYQSYLEAELGRWRKACRNKKAPHRHGPVEGQNVPLRCPERSVVHTAAL